MEILFETERLYFKRFRADEIDAANILSMNRLPEVLQYLHEPTLTTIEDANRILAQHILPQYELGLGRWSVHLKKGDGFIGWCGLKLRPERNNEIDLGYRFLPAYWNKGYASEAAGACLKYGFRKLQLEQVNACAHIENYASLRILEKIGMKLIGEDIVDNCPVRCFVLHKPDFT